jgi:hypothetical protein
MASQIEWVTGRHCEEKTAKNGSSYFFIIGVTENLERRKIFVDKRHEADVAHFIWGIKNGKEVKIPIYPDQHVNGRWRVEFDAVDATPPKEKILVNPINKMLVNQLTFVSSNAPCMANHKTKQSFKLDSQYVKKVETLAGRQKITKSDFYAKAVSHFLDLEDYADTIGI